MQYKDCTIKLLGIQGVDVKKIEENEKGIYVYIETKSKVHCCPSCKNTTKNTHDYRQQRIQHIQTNGLTIYLILNKRRYICPHCGKKFYEKYSFLQRYFRKSNSVFHKIINDLKQLKNFKTIAKDNHVSSPTVVRYLTYQTFLTGKNVVFTLPKHIGIDEFKGNCNKTKYQFHIFDLDTHTTVDILESRKYDDLERYFSKIANRSSVEIVSMDLYSPFKRIIKDKFPKAKIVADNFHFTRIAMQPLDDLRLNLWRNAKGNEKKYFKYLKLSLMKDLSKVKDSDTEKLLYAFELSPTLKAAYILKQDFLNIKKCITFEEKEAKFRKWLYDADCSTIKEFKTAVSTLRQWHEYISNSFQTNFSNGPTEGKNNLIKTIKRISFGYRNLQNFRNRILLIQL